VFTRQSPASSSRSWPVVLTALGATLRASAVGAALSSRAGAPSASLLIALASLRPGGGCVAASSASSEGTKASRAADGE
ncbi:unnamed protein product, partial [Polarella glacialis]